MAGYVYKGSQPLVPAENVPPAPIVRYARKPFLAELCGSLRGYNQHRRYENPPCRGCMDAHNTSRRERNAARLAANQNAHNRNKIRRGIVRETDMQTGKISSTKCNANGPEECLQHSSGPDPDID
jgi:hypothetical protein